MVENMAYEGKRNKISPIYLHPKKECVSPCPTKQQTEENKYLDIYLDRKRTWHKHISAKRKQLDLRLRKMYWIIGRKSQLSPVNRLLVYKAILKPTWAYGVKLWGSASKSNL
jgi:hypothetical protein